MCEEEWAKSNEGNNNWRAQSEGEGRVELKCTLDPISHAISLHLLEASHKQATIDSQRMVRSIKCKLEISDLIYISTAANPLIIAPFLTIHAPMPIAQHLRP